MKAKVNHVYYDPKKDEIVIPIAIFQDPNSYLVSWKSVTDYSGETKNESHYCYPQFFDYIIDLGEL